MGRERQRQRDIGLLKGGGIEDAGGIRERETETKTFIHSSALQPQGFDSVSYPVLLLETSITGTDRDLSSWRSQAKGEMKITRQSPEGPELR